MRILFWGNGERGESCLREILIAGFDVVAVIDQRRDTSATQSLSLETQSQASGISYHRLRSLRSQESLDLVNSYSADLFVLAGYARLLPAAMINIPPMGVINTHAGRIPEYRGTAAIPWQIIRGEHALGLTILYADEGVDTGDVLLIETYELGPDEGATEAVATAVNRFPKMLVEVLQGLQEGSLSGHRQDLTAGSQYTRRQPDDGMIDCKSMNAEDVFNLIRGLTPPYPGAFGWVGSEKVVIHKAKLLKENIYGVPGRMPFFRNDGIVLICRDRGILVTEVRSGDHIIPARDLFQMGDSLTCGPRHSV